MNFLYVQILIFILMIISSIIGGKKGTFICGAVWIIATVISISINRFNNINYFQLMTVAVSFQLSLIIAAIRDLIVKKLMKKNKA